MSVIPVFVFVLFSFRETLQEDPTLHLEVGTPIRGTIEASDPVIETGVLLEKYANAPVRGTTFRLRVPEPGAYHIDLRSYFFDAYLVLRDDAGAVLSEDDDGLLATHAGIVIEDADPQRTYVLDVCALHGNVGEFELRLVAGKPKELTPIEVRDAVIADRREAVRVVEEAEGLDSPAMAACITELGRAFLGAGQYQEACQSFEQTWQIYERIKGPKHYLTAAALYNLAFVLEELGEYDKCKSAIRKSNCVQESHTRFHAFQYGGVHLQSCGHPGGARAIRSGEGAS